MVFYGDSVAPIYSEANSLIKYGDLPDAALTEIQKDFQYLTEQDFDYQAEFVRIRSAYFKAHGIDVTFE